MVTVRPLRLLDFRSLGASCWGEVPWSARLLAAPRCSFHRVPAAWRGAGSGAAEVEAARGPGPGGRGGRQDAAPQRAAERRAGAAAGGLPGRLRGGMIPPGSGKGKPGDGAAPLPARPAPHSPIRASAAAPAEESGCPRGAAARTCSSGGSSSARTEPSAPIMPGPSQAAVPLPARRRQTSLHVSRSPFASPAPESGSRSGFNTQDSDRRRPPAPEPAPPRPDPLRPAEAALPARLPPLCSPPGGAAVRVGLRGCPEGEWGAGRFCPLGAS